MDSIKNSNFNKIKRLWHQIDASKLTLGRIATIVANLLRGKQKRNYTPNLDMGDFVVAVNVDKIQLSGRKIQTKKYYRHSGYLGGLKIKSLQNELKQNPGLVLRRAVYNMLDDLKFRKKIIARLKLIKGSAHPHKINKIW